MSELYTNDTSKLTFRECWNLTRDWKFLILAGARLFGGNLGGGMPIPCPRSIRDWQLEREELPEFSRDGVEDCVRRLEALGFHSPFFYAPEQLSPESSCCGMAMLHESGDVFAVRLHARSTMVHPPLDNVVVSFVSVRPDGTFLETVDQREQLLGPSGDDIFRFPNAPLETLWRAHQENLATSRATKPIRRLTSVDEMIVTVDYNEKRAFDFHVRRGHYRPMTPAEEADLRRKRSSRDQIRAAPPLPATAPPAPETRSAPPPLSAGGVSEASPEQETAQISEENALIYAELQKLQEGKESSWGGALILLAISIGLFVGLGAWRWSWDMAAALVPILFVHELGHYIAMRAFGYRNVKMFFIPLLGAAVSGRKYNVPGWKKVAVSLAGPLPSIAIGAVLAVAGAVTGEEWLTKAALLTLILNGFNLLPVLPLDGGWVVHNIFFCRHPLLDVFFRILTTLALIGGGIATGDRFLWIIGIFMGMGIPMAHRAASIGRDLRQRGLSQDAVEGDAIPPATANAIIDEVRARYAAPLPDKNVAQIALQIFENLNARPPGAWASAAFLAAHAIGVATAIVFAALCVMGQDTAMGNFMRMAAETPEQEYVCGTIRTWTGAEFETRDSSDVRTVVATFEGAEQAETQFAALTNELSGVMAARLFGQTILVSTPTAEQAGRDRCFNRLEGAGGKVFVGGTNQLSSLTVVTLWPTPEAAEEVEKALKDHLMASSIAQALLPPWHPDDPRSPESREAHDKARKTYARLINRHNETAADDAEEAEINESKAAEVEQLLRRLSEARRRGNDAEAESIQDELGRRDKAANDKFYASLRAEGPETLDLEVIDLYEKHQEQFVAFEPRETIDTTRLDAIAERMGLAAAPGADAESGADRYSSRGGFTRREGPLLRIEWLRFANDFEGVPALADWLCDKGCLEFHYRFNNGFGFEDLSDL